MSLSSFQRISTLCIALASVSSAYHIDRLHDLRERAPSITPSPSTIAARHAALGQRDISTPSPSSWTPGACTLTTFDDPTTTLICPSTTIAPMKATACACPDQEIYVRLSGGDADPCHDWIDNSQPNLKEAIFSKCPADPNASTTASSSAASSLSATLSATSSFASGISASGSGASGSGGLLSSSSTGPYANATTASGTGGPTGSTGGSGISASGASATGTGLLGTGSASSSTITSSPTSTGYPTGNAGAFTVSPPVYPSTCSAENVVYSSEQAVPTGQLQIAPTIDWGKVDSVWSFSVGKGHQIVNMTGISNPDTGGQFGGQPKEPPSNNFTHTANGTWQMTVLPNMPTQDILAWTSGGSPNETAPFTITAMVPCDKPIGYECNTTDHDLTQEAWEAYQVDNFLEEYAANYTKAGKKNWWPDFIDTFIGDAFAANCAVDQDEGCGPITNSCQDAREGPYRRQAYLVMSAMMTLSRYLHFAYDAFGQSNDDLDKILPDWDVHFNVPEKTIGWQQEVAAAASVFGILSVVGFAAAPFSGGASLAVGALASGLFGVNALLNGAINFAAAGGTVPAVDIQFHAWSDAAKAMGNYINGSQSALIQTHNAYFLEGLSVPETLHGGVFVGDNMLKSVTDGSVSGFVKQAAGWFDKQAILGLINSAWKENNNYIVFIPYGPVGFYGKGNRDFQKEDCQSRFLDNDDWAGTIYASCDAGPEGHEGMSMFMVPQNDGQTNEYNKKSFYDVKDYTINGDYTFTPIDVLKSSLSGYFSHGFDYKITDDDVSKQLHTQSNDPLSEIAKIEPWDAGVFNLPVCVIYDFKYVPACTITDWGNGNDPCVTQPGFCAGSGSNVTVFNGGKEETQFFKDKASKGIMDGLASAKCYQAFAC